MISKLPDPETYDKNIFYYIDPFISFKVKPYYRFTKKDGTKYWSSNSLSGILNKRYKI